MKTLSHKFIDVIPDYLEKDVLYISLQYKTVVHKCVCGCGNEVITPLTPTDWKLIFDGKTISLYPSIGNWSFECKSHYWIKNNRIIYTDKSNHREQFSKRKFSKNLKKRFNKWVNKKKL